MKKKFFSCDTEEFSALLNTHFLATTLETLFEFQKKAALRGTDKD